MFRPFRFAFAALATCASIVGVVALAAPGIASASGWPGTIQLKFAPANGPLQDVTPSPTSSLGALLASDWTKVTKVDPTKSTTSPVCSDLESLIPEVHWDSCQIPTIGDLQAQAIDPAAPGQLHLTFAVPGNSIAFDAPSEPTDPELYAAFDLEIDVTLQVDPTIADDGSGSPSGPISLASAVVRFSNAHATTANIGANAVDASGQLENLIDNEVVPLSDTGMDLTGAIASANTELDTVAQQLSSNQLKPAPNEYLTPTLDLATSVDANYLTFTFSHGSPPPQPLGCSFWEPPGSDQRAGDVYATCGAWQPDGVTDLFLQVLYGDPGGQWSAMPGDPRSFYGDPSWADSPETILSGGSWTFQVSGQPALVGSGQSGPAEVRVCSKNEWGIDCTTPVSVVIPIPTGPLPPHCGPGSHPYNPCHVLKVAPAGIITPPSPLGP